MSLTIDVPDGRKSGGQVSRDNGLGSLMPALSLGVSLTEMNARRCCRRWSWESIDVDRSRKVSFGGMARKPAPMLVPDRLTVKMTVKICAAAARALRIKSLEGSLMIEWE